MKDCGRITYVKQSVWLMSSNALQSALVSWSANERRVVDILRHPW